MTIGDVDSFRASASSQRIRALLLGSTAFLTGNCSSLGNCSGSGQYFAISGSLHSGGFFNSEKNLSLARSSSLPLFFLILEGGLEDATNVFTTPLLSVLTPISIDHQKFLGTTLSQIATHKAGIIKSGCPVVVGVQPFREARDVFEVCQFTPHIPSESEGAAAPANALLSCYARPRVSKFAPYISAKSK